jgi:hypothetical protein
MKVPSYIMTGGDAYFWGSEELAESGQFFGFSATFESEINEDPVTIPGGLKAFATHTLPWYYLNRLLRDRFTGDTARFSYGVVSTWPGKPVIQQGEALLQDGNDVFIPALWKPTPEIIAYSEKGYRQRKWQLPPAWAGVKEVDLYTITPVGLTVKSLHARVLSDRKVELSLLPDEGLVIVPGGSNPDEEKIPVASGEVTFYGTDNSTKGNWSGKYGSEGYHIPGAGEKMPDQAKINLINGELNIWENETRDIQAIVNPLGIGRLAANWSHPLHEIIDLDFKDGKEHDVSIYFLDWDRKSRWCVVDIIDADSRSVLHSYNLTDFQQGIYLRYKMKGHLQCRLTNIWTRRCTQSPDVGFSALFLDTVKQ